MPPDQVADVIVVGAGNAAFCAALAAQEHGAKVVMLEAAPQEESGGNSRFTAGSIRVVYNGVADIKALVPDLTPAEIESTDFGTYTADQFFDDMARVTQHRADPDLVELLVTESFATLNWMRDKGVRFIPIYGRQAFKIDGKFKFWGGLTVEAVGGGPGLVAMLTQAATKRGIAIRYRTRALDLLYDGNRVEGVRVRQDGALHELRAGAVVLACGGFEANPEWRTRYLGPPLGPRQGARHSLQHRRRHPHGARYRRFAVRQLVGLPRRAMGAERAGVRRSCGRRSIPEALLSVRHPDQRKRQAFRRRGRGFPQLHLRQIRPRGAGAARPVRLAGVRRQSEAPAARRIPDPAGHQGEREHASRSLRRNSKA